MADRSTPDLSALARAMHEVCDRPQNFTPDEIAAVMDATIRGLTELPAQRRALVERVLMRQIAGAGLEGRA